MIEYILQYWQLKLAVIILCAICKLVGELWWHDAQRFVMPILILCPIVSIIIHIWWVGLLLLPMIAPLVLGYKVYGSSDGFDRGMWLFLILVVEGLGLCLTHHLSWFIYVPWCILGGIWGATTRNLWNLIIAPISGAWIGIIILFIN